MGISLIDDEKSGVIIPNLDIQDNLKKGRRCLLGKLFYDKIMNKTVVQTMMSTV